MTDLYEFHACEWMDDSDKVWNSMFKRQEWQMLFEELKDSSSILNSYTIEIYISEDVPKKWTIKFNLEDLSFFERLRSFVGKFGFVVPTYVTESKKILKGEKKFNFKVRKKQYSTI